MVMIARVYVYLSAGPRVYVYIFVWNHLMYIGRLVSGRRGERVELLTSS